MTVYLLEMMITTPDRVVCEPLGVYDTMKKAKSHLQKVQKVRPETENISFNIMRFEMNDKPSILKMKEVAMQYIGEELFGMFQQGMLEQMVEPDGSFTYVVTDKFKTALESAITRFHDEAEDNPF
tara:strand:+ start:70 stop:444 length:375 start_codon:yes stop_codon:yes gene_type:complete